MSLFLTFFNFDLRAGSKFKLSSIFASHKVKLEHNIYLLSSSKFNFGSKFNVIICNFIPILTFELARKSNSARYSLHIRSNWNRISICYLARNWNSARKSMSLFVTFFQFRSSSWLEIQTQLDILFTYGQIGTEYLFVI